VYDTNLICGTFHQNPGGLSPKEVEEKKRQYGSNLIKITVLPIYRLILKEVKIILNLLYLKVENY
jgi:hypothetical protein